MCVIRVAIGYEKVYNIFMFVGEKKKRKYKIPCIPFALITINISKCNLRALENV